MGSLDEVSATWSVAHKVYFAEQSRRVAMQQHMRCGSIPDPAIMTIVQINQIFSTLLNSISLRVALGNWQTFMVQFTVQSLDENEAKSASSNLLRIDP